MTQTQNEHTYELIRLTVEPDYCDEWETTMVADIRRDDGVEGDIWIVAGVPDYQRGTAKTAGHTYGLMDVRVFDGGSPDTWCPATLDYHDSAAMIVAVRDAALAKHNAKMAAETE